MRYTLILSLTCVVMLSLIAGLVWADYPRPSPYPISWELKFEHDQPRRIAVDVPGSSAPKAYWYMTYMVTNETEREQTFLPRFEMLTRDGRVILSDRNIPAVVFERIKRVEGKRFLEPFTSIGGDIRIGEDEAREGVAIWEEPDPRMGEFTIFICGLSGETASLPGADGQPMKDPDGNVIILRKTLQLDFQVRGDEVMPQRHPVEQTAQQWVMR